MSENASLFADAGGTPSRPKSRLRDLHAQRIIGPVQVWVGLSFRSFYLGFSVMPYAGATLGIAFLYFGIARKPRGLL